MFAHRQVFPFTSWTRFLQQRECFNNLRHFLSGLSAAIRLSLHRKCYGTLNLLAFPWIFWKYLLVHERESNETGIEKCGNLSPVEISLLVQYNKRGKWNYFNIRRFNVLINRICSRIREFLFILLIARFGLLRFLFYLELTLKKKPFMAS